MTGASIVVTFGSISQASENTKATAGYINSELDQLKRDLSQLKSIWVGQAGDNYKAYQAKWDSAAADLNQVLADISNTLDEANRAYSQGEDANAQVWG